MLDAISKISTLSKESCNQISDILEIKNVNKGTILLEFGEIDRELHFINKGAGRVFYLIEGRDVTDYIAMDGDFLGGVESLFTQKPSHKSIELLEDSIIESLNYKKWEKLCESNHEIERAARKTAIFSFLECQKRIESIRFLSAADRYQELEKKYPGISNRIPLKHIASYLGTSQVSLSRIRKGIQ